MKDPLSFRDQLMKEHDVARSYFFGAGDIYNLRRPSHLKRVLVNDRDSFGKSDDFRIAFGDGLVASEGDQWQTQRQILQPLFTQTRIESYVSTMVKQIHRRIDTWEGGETIDLQREMRRLTLDTLFATLFGRELDLNGNSDVHEAATHLHEWFSPTSYPLPDWVPTPARRRFKRGRAKLRTIADQLLDEKSDELRTSDTEPTDLLSVLVDLRNETDDKPALSDAQLRDQVVTMVFAGHDTTATTLALALYELSRSAELRERFHEEIDDIKAPVSRETLSSLPVTERIVKETLRMYPAVYIIPRIAERDVAIDGYRIPKKAPVWLGIRQVQNDERFYDAPNTFKPFRWRNGLEETMPDFAFAPFGGGPRFCIGRQFALTEAKLALALIGRKYALTRADHTEKSLDHSGNDCVPDPPITADMTLRLTPGTEFYVSER
jgi:cytochrome P450